MVLEAQSQELSSGPYHLNSLLTYEMLVCSCLFFWLHWQCSGLTPRGASEYHIWSVGDQTWVGYIQGSVEAIVTISPIPQIFVVWGTSQRYGFGFFVLFLALVLGHTHELPKIACSYSALYSGYHVVPGIELRPLNAKHALSLLG